MSKYETLINILDRLRFDAPKEHVKYRPDESDTEKLNQARAKALIHLFLKVSFGLLTFNDRIKYVTDGSYDGGIDAYYIDKDKKKVFLIQSKFRNSSDNFENKSIQFEELLKMDVIRITDGETSDEDGNEYSGKIKQLQRELNEIPNIGRYEYEVILLANMVPPTRSSLTRLIGQFQTTIYDHKKVYEDLVFPVVSGTYFNQSELSISLNLDNNLSSSARINYNVTTSYSDCDITVVFVPTEEIGRILSKYKNSILLFNPRCYLELHSNSVNKDIYSTIVDIDTNEFALFNNGITMLSNKTSFSEHVGKKGKAQIVIDNPQIINGGQTAFTLSRIYEEFVVSGIRSDIFQNKEVLLKIITIDNAIDKHSSEKLNLIESISKATNSQSVIENADRRSNDKIQVQLQRQLFDKYGIYYERKKGEFADGIREKYISRSQIIDRDHLLRLALSCDLRPSQARRSSSRVIFEESQFSQVLSNENRASEYFYAYKVHQELTNIEKRLSSDKHDPFGTVNYGQALRYGKYAVTCAVVCAHFKDESSIENVNVDTQSILNNWMSFEQYAINLPENNIYFREFTNPETESVTREYNFDGYYKGRTVNQNLDSFFEITFNEL